MLALGSRFFQEGMINRRTVLRSIYAQLVYKYLGANERRLKRIEESVLALTQGWDQSVVRRIVSEGLSEIITPLIYKEAIELMELHKLSGRKVYIVSASPEEVVAPLAGFLGADGYIASRSKVDENGIYLGEMEFYAYGPYKVQAMKELAEVEGIDLARSYAYSDSYTDLPMLEAVGHPVAVNPDRVLARVAKERGWETADFYHTTKISRPHLAKTMRNLAIVLIVLGSSAAPIIRYVLIHEKPRNESTKELT